jgi:hypothetical protein
MTRGYRNLFCLRVDNCVGLPKIFTTERAENTEKTFLNLRGEEIHSQSFVIPFCF